MIPIKYKIMTKNGHMSGVNSSIAPNDLENSSKKDSQINANSEINSSLQKKRRTLARKDSQDYN